MADNAEKQNSPFRLYRFAANDLPIVTLPSKCDECQTILEAFRLAVSEIRVSPKRKAELRVWRGMLLTQRGAVGVWNCESSDYIEGCDGTCIHAVGFLAGAGGWSITNVAAFPIFPVGTIPDSDCFLPVTTSLHHRPLRRRVSPRFSTGVVNKAVCE